MITAFFMYSLIAKFVEYLISLSERNGHHGKSVDQNHRKMIIKNLQNVRVYHALYQKRVQSP
jgi:hypothetical protein